MATPKMMVATKPLFVGTARAYNPGDLVSADAVERNGWADDVEPVKPKARSAKKSK